jgi:hypothetical protein
MWKTLLTKQQTIDIFRLTLNEHINRKISFIKDVLIKNNLKNRSSQIKDNIEITFKAITWEEAEKLWQFNTPAWNIWEILRSNVN